MMRSLFAGVSGLRNHQTRMDVIGNNIANVNTPGFKRSRVTFQDMLSQTLRGASSPQANRGGTNPIQVGLGMSISSIDVIHTPGSPQSTGKNTDLSIEGEGFFLVSDGSNIYYTRAGNFDFDFNKTFVHVGTGMVAQGIMADSNGYINPNGDIVNINLASQVSSPPQATSVIRYAKNLSSLAEVAPEIHFGTVTHADSGTETYALNPANLPLTGVIIDDGSGPLVEGVHYTVNYATGEISFTTDAPAGTYDIFYKEPTYFVSATAYDSKGFTHQVNIYFTKTGPNQWEVMTALEGEVVNGGRGTLTFSPETGKLTNSTVTPIQKSLADAADLNITLDFSNLTENANPFSVMFFSQDGYPAGDLEDLSVDSSGTITGSFSNGQNRKLAQLVLANFSNPAGLIKMGSTLFRASNNSGTPDVGVPGVSGRGLIKPEGLEMSNVDLSQEFVDMIITQRGFQANSRIISASDQILEELVNMKR